MPEIPGLVLHNRYHRSEVADALGVKVSRYWQQGVIRVGDRYLVFITLDKQELPPQYRYNDHFLSPSLLHWQSQNQDSREGRGRKYRDHSGQGRSFHLFVRRSETDLEGNSDRFAYLGQIKFKDWQGDNPINVRWELETDVPSILRAELLVP